MPPNAPAERLGFVFDLTSERGAGLLLPTVPDKDMRLGLSDCLCWRICDAKRVCVKGEGRGVGTRISARASHSGQTRCMMEAMADKRGELLKQQPEDALWSSATSK